jgi:hypothetical protein
LAFPIHNGFIHNDEESDSCHTKEKSNPVERLVVSEAGLDCGGVMIYSDPSKVKALFRLSLAF